MALNSNPLQQFFRQPKIYIKLPSQGAYCQPGTIQGDVNNMPVYSLTGMDEIILKTPDALLTGESSVRVIESCVPGIKNAWDMSILDSQIIFTAMRIATFGNEMTVTNTCNKCSEENEYDLDLTRIIEHFANIQYDSKIILKELVIKLQPLNYRQSTDFNLRNFRLQQKIRQAENIEDRTEQQNMINALFEELSVIQNELYKACVDSVEVNNKVVTERVFINEWMDNCDKEVFDSIKKHIEEGREKWKSPTYPVKCDSCGNETNLFVELDQSNFFDAA
jgi:hypothetical protein